MYNKDPLEQKFRFSTIYDSLMEMYWNISGKFIAHQGFLDNGILFASEHENKLTVKGENGCYKSSYRKMGAGTRNATKA